MKTEVEKVITELNKLIRARTYTMQLNKFKSSKKSFEWTEEKKKDEIIYILDKADPTTTLVGVGYYYLNPKQMNILYRKPTTMKKDILKEIMARIKKVNIIFKYGTTTNTKKQRLNLKV